MYNYYTEIRKQKENEDKTKQEEKHKKYQEKRKKEIHNLVENYENRIKGFVYQMATSPVKIKDYQQKITSSRKEFLEEENGKIIGDKGFVFKKFKTEKQRIEEYLKQKETIYIRENMLQLAFGEKYKNDPKVGLVNNDISHSNVIIQPSMRFKARTDLERIFDAINDYSYGRVDRDIIEKQLKNLDLNVSKKPIPEEDEMIEEIPDYPSSAVKRLQNQIKIDKEREQREKAKEEKKKKFKRRYVDNSQARKMMSDLHLKTHFKGASGFTLFKNSSVMDKNLFKTVDTLKSPQSLITTSRFQNLNKKNYETFNNTPLLTYGSNNSLNTSIQLQKQPNQSPRTDKYMKTTFDTEPNLSKKKSMTTMYNPQIFSSYVNETEMSQDIIDNPIFLNLNKNPLKKATEKTLDETKLTYLKNLAFAKPKEQVESTKNKKLKTAGFFKKLALRNKKKEENNEENPKKKISFNKKIADFNGESVMQHSPMSFFQKYADNPDIEVKMNEEEKIFIDGEQILKSDIYKISKKVLTGCNYLHSKNKNNPISHKMGSGKMMFSSGMTINEFVKKYNLKFN